MVGWADSILQKQPVCVIQIVLNVCKPLCATLSLFTAGDRDPESAVV